MAGHDRDLRGSGPLVFRAETTQLIQLGRATWSVDCNEENGFRKCYSMAGDDCDRNRRLDGRLTKKVQEKLGVLAVSS